MLPAAGVAGLVSLGTRGAMRELRERLAPVDAVSQLRLTRDGELPGSYRRRDGIARAAVTSRLARLGADGTLMRSELLAGTHGYRTGPAGARRPPDRGGLDPMRLREIPRLVRVARPPAPYGVRALDRCFSVEDLARVARRRLPSGARGYLEGGGEDEYTLRRNRAAFDELQLIPRVLRDVSRVDTAARVLGSRLRLPIVLAPVGAARMFHHEGELAVARAAGHAGVAFGISTLGTVSVEAVAAETDAPLWFQLYVWGDRSAAKEALARARAAGFRALLVTADTTVRSKRERELRAGMTLPTPELTLRAVADGALHPRWAWHFLTSEAISFPNVDPRGCASHAKLADMFDGTVTWEDLEWIRAAWDGPIALKGVVRADEARRAADEGLDAVIVSNHGGRQLDHVPATIEVLAEVVDAVEGRLEVLLDSGVRRGSDIVAALALGAHAVLVGRAHLYGLAAAGEAGVRHAIDILTHELRMTMALTGAARISDLDRSVIRAATHAAR